MVMITSPEMAKDAMMDARPLVVVKGAGDLGTGVIYRLTRADFPVVATEIAQPTTIRRTVALAEAAFSGESSVEGMRARRVEGSRALTLAIRDGVIPILVEPDSSVISRLRPGVLVDAIMARRNTGTTIHDADIVIALGPGFTAGVDAHAVIETQRGHRLGRVILEGQAEPSTGVPGEIGGETARRVLRAPATGMIRCLRAIGDMVSEGDVVARVEGISVQAQVSGVLRGIAKDGMTVIAGRKVGDVDPRAKREYCFTISDKALAIGGGVLEAVLFLQTRQQWMRT